MSLLSRSYNNNVISPNKVNELKFKILYVIMVLILYRLGTYVPLPSINSIAATSIADNNTGGLLGMFNVFTGGAIGRLSIFALNIMPYITASIIMQLMSVISKDIGNLKKDGNSGRKKINQYTRYLTVLLSLIQGYGIAIGIENMVSAVGPVVTSPGLMFRLTSTLSLMAGTLFVMWLGEQITLKGIGNGSSLIIFTGIVSGLPNALLSFFEMGRIGTISTFMVVIIVILIIGMISLIVFIEKAQRKILIQYPKRQVGNKIFGGDSSHLPLKINTAGVIPPIFAGSILSFFTTIIGLTQNNISEGWKQFFSEYLTHGKIVYVSLYVFLIIFFSFFYTSVVFNPDETAENLKKNGGVVLGRKPGKNTANYFDYILTRLTVIGSCYIAFICVVPEVLVSEYSVPFYLGGTSLLIVVNVIMDMFSQIQTHLLANQYGNLIRKVKLRGYK